MKTKNVLYIATLLLLFTACNSAVPVDVLTRVNSDGSIDRTYKTHVNNRFMSGDTSEIASVLPMMKNAKDWDISWKYKQEKEQSHYPLTSDEISRISTDSTLRNPFEIGITQHFENADALNDYSAIRSLSNQKITVSLTKKFRWFYTYYEYTEIHPKIQSKTQTIPVSTYLTDAEADYWFNGNTSYILGLNGLEIKDINDNINDKYEKWLAHLIWNEMYAVYEQHFDQLGLTVSKQTFSQLSDTIFQDEAEAMQAHSFYIDKILDSRFKTRAFSDFTAKNDSLFGAVENELIENQLFIASSTYNYALEMPGQILSGNYYQDENNQLRWKVTVSRMLLNDCVIQAQSRKANIWAFAIAGIVILLALWSVVKPARKRL